MVDELKPGQLIDERFRLGQMLGQGNFGLIVAAWDYQLKREVAVKFHRPIANRPMLMVTEILILGLAKSRSCANIVPLLHQGYLHRDGTPYLILEKLGPSVEQLLEQASLRDVDGNTRFPKAKALHLVSEMLEGLHQVHQLGFVYRDVKPSNFAIGIPPKNENRVFILDFGRCRAHSDSNGAPIPPRMKPKFRGPPVYASLSGHYRKDLHRGDDLISLSYVLVHFVTGSLPWLRLQDVECVESSKENSDVDLANSLPQNCQKFYSEVRKISWNETPDYNLMKNYLLKDLLAVSKSDRND